MLEIVQFESGKYGIRNKWTGILLTKRNGKPWTYGTFKRAERRMFKLVANFNKSIRSLR